MVAYNDQNRVVCVYPVSGQYGLLPRLLYYALIVFSIVAQQQSWLVVGAIASAMTYSGTAAIHAVVLAAVSVNPVFDLDIVGVWAVASAGCVAVVPILDWSKTLLYSPYRPVFGFWGSLMAIGSICGIVAILRDYPDEVACRSSSAQLLTEPAQIMDPRFNCTYTCFATHQPLRAPSQMTVIWEKVVFGYWQAILFVSVAMVLLTGVLMGSLGCLPGPRKHTEKELDDIIRRNAPCRNDLSKARYYKRQARERAYKERKTGEIQHQRSCCGYINPPIFIIVIILNELYIRILPVDEAPYAVGQWGAVVGVCLALIAAAINKYNEYKRSRQPSPDIPLTIATRKAENATSPPEAGVPAEVITLGHQTTPEDCAIDLEAAVGIESEGRSVAVEQCA